MIVVTTWLLPLHDCCYCMVVEADANMNECLCHTVLSIFLPQIGYCHCRLVLQKICFGYGIPEGSLFPFYEIHMPKGYTVMGNKERDCF